MKGRFLLDVKISLVEKNIFANRSALVLSWLLLEGVKKERFSLREVAQETGVSVGLVQRVFSMAYLHGFIDTEGMRTAKSFFMKRPKLLLKSWLEQYSVVKKCKMWTYGSGLINRTALLKALDQSTLQSSVALALHSAAEAYGCKNTNLETLELYLLDAKAKEPLEQALHLVPKQRGYEVLLIEPYYKSMLASETGQKIRPSNPLLTFLDLYHYPLRGVEQAEWMALRVPELKRLFKND